VTAYSDLNEGDIVPVPCGHCTSISLYVELHVRVATAPCGKCGERSTVEVMGTPGGWTISACKVDPKPMD